MAKVQNLQAIRYLDSTGLSRVLLDWNDVISGVPDISSFSAYRSSGSLDSSYIKIADGIQVSNYLDTEARMDEGIHYYYKVTYTTPEGESSLSDADIADVYTYKDVGFSQRLWFVMAESLRRLNWLLDAIGEKCNIYIRKRAGDRCPDCWDAQSKKAMDPNCSTCYGVGFVGGYIKLENQRVVIEGAQEKIVETEFGVQPTYAPTGWVSNLPIIEERDVIVRGDNKRYYITGVNKKRLQNYLIQQTFSLAILPISHPIYNL